MSSLTGLLDRGTNRNLCYPTCIIRHLLKLSHTNFKYFHRRREDGVPEGDTFDV